MPLYFGRGRGIDERSGRPRAGCERRWEGQNSDRGRRVGRRVHLIPLGPTHPVSFPLRPPQTPIPPDPLTRTFSFLPKHTAHPQLLPQSLPYSPPPSLLPPPSPVLSPLRPRQPTALTLQIRPTTLDQPACLASPRRVVPCCAHRAPFITLMSSTQCLAAREASELWGVGEGPGAAWGREEPRFGKSGGGGRVNYKGRVVDLGGGWSR